MALLLAHPAHTGRQGGAGNQGLKPGNSALPGWTTGDAGSPHWPDWCALWRAGPMLPAALGRRGQRLGPGWVLGEPGRIPQAPGRRLRQPGQCG